MDTGLVNRQDELARLLMTMERTVSDKRATVALVCGDPGIGKTKLLSAFKGITNTERAQHQIVSGYGQALSNSLASDALQPIRECLRSLVDSANKPSSREVMGRVAVALRSNAPDWLQSVPVVGSLLAASYRTGRTVMSSDQKLNLDSPSDQIVQFINQLTKSNPVLLIFDDLHWADAATIDFLMTLVFRVEGPLMLVMSYRQAELEAEENPDTHPLRKAIFRIRRYRSDCLDLSLGKLSTDHIETIIRNTARSAPIERRAVQSIVERSDGNPLFAESLALVGGPAKTTGPVSDTPREIKSVLEERLSFLSERDQQLLEFASIVGYVFEVEYVASLARLDLDDVYDRLDILMSSHGLISPAQARASHDRYVLHHPLLADVLRGRLFANQPRWRRSHKRLLTILGDEDSWDAELTIRAVSYAIEAGEKKRGQQLALRAARAQFSLGAVTKARQLATIAAGSTTAVRGPMEIEAMELLATFLSAEANHIEAASACAQWLDATRFTTTASEKRLVSVNLFSFI